MGSLRSTADRDGVLAALSASRLRSESENVAVLRRRGQLNLALDLGIDVPLVEFSITAPNYPLPQLPHLVLVELPLADCPLRLLIALRRTGARLLVERLGSRWRVERLATLIAIRMVRAGGVRIRQGLVHAEARLDVSAPGPLRRSGLVLVRGARLLVDRARSMEGRYHVTTAHLAGPRLAAPDYFLPRRVLMINSALAWGGAERQLVNSMIGLAERGWDVRLACENLGRVPDSLFFAPELTRHGLSFTTLDDCGSTDAPSPVTAEVIAARLAELSPQVAARLLPYVEAILKARPAVVHAWQDQSNVAAGVAAAIAGVPRIVLATRNMAPVNFAYHQPHMRDVYLALLTDPRVILLNNSHAGAADYARWLGISAERIAVVHNGLRPIEPTARSTLPRQRRVPAAAPLVASIFRFYAEKDPRLWVETAATVAAARPDVHFLAIGAGPMLAEARGLAERRGFADRLHLPGALEKPWQEIVDAQVFLMSSRFEGLPNVLIEAQSLGLPVVSTPAGGSSETFLDGETGWLVTERDPGRLAERVLAVLDDPAWRARCAVLAPQNAEARFGLERMIDDTVTLYAR